MASDGIVEPVDVAANGLVGFLTGVEGGAPDELGFQGLKERLHHGIVVAIPFAGHRDQDAVLAELGLIVDRAILGGFKRWSQHGRCLRIEATDQVSLPAFSNRASFGVGS